jgi:hypothetical protein
LACFLAAHGAEIVADDIDGPSVSRVDARMLLLKRRADEVCRREVVARLEQERAGLPVDRIPAGMSATEAMLLADPTTGRVVDQP